MSTLQFADTCLFAPVGIETAYWRQDRTGIYKGGTQLSMRPRDLARIGVLCLNEGVWDGQWLNVSTKTHILVRPDYFAGRGYAYHWWTADEFAAYYAAGSQGQNLYIFPESDLVVVVTGTIARGEILPDRLVAEYVLPSLDSAVY